MVQLRSSRFSPDLTLPLLPITSNLPQMDGSERSTLSSRVREGEDASSRLDADLLVGDNPRLVRIDLNMMR
jgi:hypothetical protein